MKTKANILESVPSKLVDWYLDEETQLIVLKRPKFYSDRAKKFIGPFLKKDHYLVKLDNLGTAVWKNCDGKNNVRKIGELLAAEFGPSIEPIYERLSKFIIQMYKSKLIELRYWQ